jgi:predicted MFS family arabinose efflux permease
MNQSEPISQTARTTFRLDQLRGGFQGLMEMCAHTFGLLVAIRYFHAETFAKALIPAAFSIGLLINPWSIQAVSRLGFRASKATAFIYGIAALLFVGVALSRSMTTFILFFVAVQWVLAQIVPLLVAIYSRNYPEAVRGSRFSSTTLITALVGSLGVYIGGLWLDNNLEHFRYLFLVGALAAALAGLVTWRIPTDTLSIEESGNPFKNLNYIWKDSLFGWMLAGWMLIGMANLMSLPIRVEYMVNPDFGIEASNEQIAMILGSIPLLFRLLSIKIWGRLFDLKSFIHIRIWLNLIFLCSIVLFFTTHNLWIMGIAMAFFGLALGGANIVWALWVTKITDPQKAPVYMSIHTALTGVRGSLAPFFGYFLLAAYGPQSIALVAGILIVISTALFMRIQRKN